MVLLHLISKKIKSNRQTHMIFVKNYRPTRYENWQITGLLNHLHTRGTIIYCLFRSGDYLLLGVALIFFFFFFLSLLLLFFFLFSSSYQLVPKKDPDILFKIFFVWFGLMDIMTDGYMMTRTVKFLESPKSAKFDSQVIILYENG